MVKYLLKNMANQDSPNSELAQCWKVLKGSQPDHVRSAFLNYCAKNIELFDMGILSKKDAAYNMCGACAFLPEAISSEFSELMNLVCDLELPEYIRPSKESEWSEVVTIIKQKTE